jgi:hypothetical protein
MTTRGRNSLKHREATYLELGRSLLSRLPTGPTAAAERPDFLVRTSEGMAGIEVTCFSSLAPRAHQQTNHYRVILPVELQRVLNRKGRLLSGYSLPGSAVWLLVVVDRRLPRCTGWITPDLVLHNYRSAFRSVALLDFPVGKAWELQITS